MFARIISVAIVAFWLVMMTLLVRTELLYSTPLTYSVPIERVMQKMFEAQEPSDLVIFYQGDRVGTCSIQITRQQDGPSPVYRVQSELTLDFQIFGKGVRLQSTTDSVFDRRYQMTRFESHTQSGTTRIELKGDLLSQQIELKFRVGDTEERHVMPFSTLEQMGPSGAMGLFGMGGLQLPQAGEAPARNFGLPLLDKQSRGPTTTVQDNLLRVGKEKLPTLLVDTKYDESLWSKVYVGSMGEVLKVETSFGVTMLSAQFAAMTQN